MHETSRSLVEIDNWQRVPLRVITAGRKGRSVVAEGRIEKGELIECAPVLIVPEAERHVVDATNIGNYIFMWEYGTTAKDLETGKGRAGRPALLAQTPLRSCLA